MHDNGDKFTGKDTTIKNLSNKTNDVWQPSDNDGTSENSEGIETITLPRSQSDPKAAIPLHSPIHTAIPELYVKHMGYNKSDALPGSEIFEGENCGVPKQVIHTYLHHFLK